MNEEELIQQCKDILNKMTDGCDNLIELESKCMFCMNNGENYEGKMLCMKKFEEGMA